MTVETVLTKNKKGIWGRQTIITTVIDRQFRSGEKVTDIYFHYGAIVKPTKKEVVK